MLEHHTSSKDLNKLRLVELRIVIKSTLHIDSLQFRVGGILINATILITNDDGVTFAFSSRKLEILAVLVNT